MSRSARAFVVGGMRRPERRVRLRRRRTVSLEGSDGSALVQSGGFYWGNKVANGADLVDVAMLLLCFLSGLNEQLERFRLA